MTDHNKILIRIAEKTSCKHGNRKILMWQRFFPPLSNLRPGKNLFHMYVDWLKESWCYCNVITWHPCKQWGSDKWNEIHFNVLTHWAPSFVNYVPLNDPRTNNHCHPFFQFSHNFLNCAGLTGTDFSPKWSSDWGRQSNSNWLQWAAFSFN